MDSDPGLKHLVFLKKHFGHSQFRPMQWKIINNILKGEHDQCVVMATGHGKSLCYQYPAVYLNAITIVISPLISLMQDQVLSLTMMNIPACFLGSAQKNMGNTLDGLLNNKYRLVYLTPEFCSGEYGRDILAKLRSKQKICLVAIDEAHCVSQWGFDFRPSYRKLGSLKQLLPDIPFLTVTASATRPVCKDICVSLDLKNPEIIFTDFDRPNLFLAVWLKGRDAFSDLRRFMVRDGLRLKFPGPTIIYCPTVKVTEIVATSLTDNGVKCHHYHAQMKMSLREETHENFTKDIINVISATSAFGMGIDKPDVRLIIHYGAPKEIESYYQEIGRAGRDGLPAACHIFYANADFVVNSFFNSHLQGKFREHREAMSRLMEKYLEAQTCRRDILISYFDDKHKGKGTPQQNCCDICNKSLNNKVSETDKPEMDISEDAVLLLKAIKVFKGYCGLGLAVQFVCGSHAKTAKSMNVNHPLFGVGKKKSQAWWKAIGRILIREELVRQQSLAGFGKGGKGGFNRFASTLSVAESGESYIRDPETRNRMKLMPSNDMLAMMKSFSKEEQPKPLPVKETPAKLIEFTFSQRNMPKLITGAINAHDAEKENKSGTCSSSSVSVSNNGDVNGGEDEGITDEETALQYDVYYGLIKKRTDLAREHGCMPYMIANNQLLLALAKDRPHTMDELKRVEGLGEVKAEKFGRHILETIKSVEECFKNKPKEKFVEDAKCDSEDSEDSLVLNNIVEEITRECQSENNSSKAAEEDVWGEEDDSFLLDQTFEDEICRNSLPTSENSGLHSSKNNSKEVRSFEKVASSDASNSVYKVENITSMHTATNSAKHCNNQLSPILGGSFSNRKSMNKPAVKKRAIKFIDSDEDENSISQSQTQKKLPNWMLSQNSTSAVNKKPKKCSLFK